MLSKNNFYNPFIDSYLGFLAGPNPSQLNETEFILRELDLYYQPVPDPQTSSLFFTLMAIELLCGLFIHKKILAMLKKEDGILKNITRVFVLCQGIFWPTSIIMITITNFTHNFHPLISELFCPCIWFLLYAPMNVICSHSFVAAVMRYVFIVHSDKVNHFGKETVKKMFLAFSVLVPLLLTIWKATDASELDMMSYMNKCYGRFHNVFLIETSALKVVQKTFGLCDVTEYDELSGLDKIVSLLKQAFCMASTSIMLFMGSNLTEGFIYYRLFTIMKK